MKDNMATINLFEIETNQTNEFIKSLESRGLKTKKSIVDYDDYEVTIYYLEKGTEKNVPWSNVTHDFGIPPLRYNSYPCAVVVYKNLHNKTYAVTFGNSYYLVNRYCNNDFGVNFCKKVTVENVKTCTAKSYNSAVSKVVYSYSKETPLLFVDGYSFAKVKVKASKDQCNLFGTSIEIGNSINFTSKQRNIAHVIKIIDYVSNLLETKPDITELPACYIIKDEATKTLLNSKLIKSIKDANSNISISEIDIIGAREIFNHNDEYKLYYDSFQKEISDVSLDEIILFCKENSLSLEDDILNIKVKCLTDGKSSFTKTVKELIEFTDDELRCVLTNGKWYKFNDDYINRINNDLELINTEYNDKFDLSDAESKAYAKELQNSECFNNKYVKERQIIENKKQLSSSSYYEAIFNIIRAERDGFKNFDRDLTSVSKHRIELMDLWKDDTYYCVKSGNTSAKLCYVVEQSITTLRWLRENSKHNRINCNMGNVKKACLWFILERKTHLPLNEYSQPQLSALKMLSLKISILNWKKEVINMGFEPRILINYKS